MSVNFDEVLDYLVDSKDFCNDFRSCVKSAYDKIFETEKYGIVELEIVEAEGGGEGEGEYVERVFKLSIGKDCAYFMSEGSYYSYQGTEMSGIYTRVYPREVIVTQYFESEDENEPEIREC